MGGKDGVPLRFPRPVAALVATATAAVTVGLSAASASADQVQQQEWWLSALNVTSAWTASRGAGVTVAVLSDGVDASHPDLAGVVTTAPAVPGAPVAAGQFLGEQGTGIASLIAGHGDGPGGGNGIIGVAPAARILSVAVTVPPDDPDLYQGSAGVAIPAAIAAGIRYAVSRGASVIDLPIDPGQPGSSGSGGNSAAAGGSAAEQSAVSYALAHNVVLVAPAGDDAQTTDAPNYPAAYRGVIAVGAFDSAFDKAAWTSRQNYVTLTAAGAGVIVASNSGSYLTMNSTSAASAVVAGVVALIRSRYPKLSVANVRTALTTTTMYHHANGLTDGSGYGAVNAAAALGAASTLATSADERAGAGAQPLATLGPAAAGRGAAQLAPQILRAAEISAGVLVLLLLVVAGYAGIRRRRRPAGARLGLAPEWTTGQTQSRYPHALVTSTDADRMLEYFATPAAAPGEPGAQLALPARPATAASSPASGGAEERVVASSAATDDVSSWVPQGPVSGAIAKRAPVSGNPPWAPAARPPEGVLPWSDTPGKQMVAGQVVASGPAAAESAPAETSPRPVRRPDWRRWQPSGGSASSGEAEQDMPPIAPPVSSQSPSRSGRQAGTGPADRAAAAWNGSAGAGSLASPQPGADPGHQSRRRDDTVPRANRGHHSRRRDDTAPPEAEPLGQHRSGLPIRQPRPVGSAPLSPSGSLWEHASGGSSLWERAEPARDAGSPDTRPDGDSRPMFVWEPPSVAADNQTGPQSD
jgi:subtilisin family serine protease